MLKPVANENGTIMFGKSGLNIKRIYGINPDQFLKIHRKIVTLGLETPFEEACTYITFELYCYELFKMKVNLSNLISEFNNNQKRNWEEVPHTLSLAKIWYHYAQYGYNVEIIKTGEKSKSPDLRINGIKCELKVRHDQIDRDMREYRHLIEKDKEQYYKILSCKIQSSSRYRTLKSALENRGEKASKQGDCVIMDLSNHFHSWNYHRLAPYLNKYLTKELSQIPLAPSLEKYIIFLPDNALDLNVAEFKPRAYWTSVPWNPETREFIDPSQKVEEV